LFLKALRHEVGDARIEESVQVVLSVPAVAEDGAVVPVTLESLIPASDRLVLLVEKNPVPLVARFHFAREALPYVSLRIRLNVSCDVVALARSGGRYFMARKPVRVVVGGCG
jgi:sulfur-oxidizing protein SoxY